MSRLRHGKGFKPLSCREVGRVLQAYLDVELDDLTARRVADHLAVCRRCGLDFESYSEIKAALARRTIEGDDALAVRRLRMFAEDLATDGPSAYGSRNGDRKRVDPSQ